MGCLLLLHFRTVWETKCSPPISLGIRLEPIVNMVAIIMVDLCIGVTIATIVDKCSDGVTKAKKS